VQAAFGAVVEDAARKAAMAQPPHLAFYTADVFAAVFDIKFEAICISL
jgi:hypothetical protein